MASQGLLSHFFLLGQRTSESERVSSVVASQDAVAIRGLLRALLLLPSFLVALLVALIFGPEASSWAPVVEKKPTLYLPEKKDMDDGYVFLCVSFLPSCW